MTAYTEVKITPGSMIRKSEADLLSAKIKEREFLKIKKIEQSAQLIKRLVKIPAETVLFCSSKRRAVFSFIISLETVIGMPEAEIVINTPITESAI